MKDTLKNQKGLNAMKMNLKLTADELMNVVDAAMDEAMEQELYFDNFGNENVEEILAVIDAALSAMGIEITEDTNSEDAAEEEYCNAFADEDEDEDDWDEEDDFDEDEEEDEDEDEEDEQSEGISIPEHEAKRLMDFAAAIFCWCSDITPEEVDDKFSERTNKFVKEMFLNFCRSEGITGVNEGE